MKALNRINHPLLAVEGMQMSVATSIRYCEPGLSFKSVSVSVHYQVKQQRTKLYHQGVKIFNENYFSHTCSKLLKLAVSFSFLFVPILS